MTIALVSTASHDTVTTSVTVSKPAGGWLSGNVLVACVCGEGGGTALTAPAAFTVIDSNTTGSLSTTYYHVCGASEPSTYTWTTSNATNHALAGCVLEYSGVNTTTPVNAHSVHPGNSVDKTIVWDSTTTTTTNGCKIVAIGAVEVDRLAPTCATPTGFTSRLTDNGGSRAADNFMGAVFCFDKDQTTAGAIGSTTALITTNSTAANTFWAGYFVALAPAAAPTTNVNVTGVSSTTSANAVSLQISSNPGLVGSSSTASAGTTSVTDAVSPAGVSSAASAGAVSVTIAKTVSGVQSTASAGTLSVSLSPNLTLTGVQASGSAGSSVVTIAPTVIGVQSAAQAGQFTPAIFTTLAGVAASGVAGTVTVLSGTIVSLVGVVTTSAAGLITISVSEAKTLTGVSSAAVAGLSSIAVSHAQTLAGVFASSAAGTVSLQISISVFPAGVLATGVVGALSVSISPTTTLVGASAASSAGSLSLQISPFVPLGGVQTSAFAGLFAKSILIPITGVEAAGQRGVLVFKHPAPPGGFAGPRVCVATARRRTAMILTRTTVAKDRSRNGISPEALMVTAPMRIRSVP